MKIKGEYEIKNISDQYVIVRNGTEIENNITLGETSIFLWNMLKEHNVSKAEMLEALLTHFDISTVLALGDIDIFVRTLKEYRMIEE